MNEFQESGRSRQEQGTPERLLLTRQNLIDKGRVSAYVFLVVDVVACSFLFIIEIGLVFSVPYCIEKNALDGCPGIEKEGRFQRRKAMGRYRL